MVFGDDAFMIYWSMCWGDQPTLQHAAHIMKITVRDQTKGDFNEIPQTVLQLEKGWEGTMLKNDENENIYLQETPASCWDTNPNERLSMAAGKTVLFGQRGLLVIFEKWQYSQTKSGNHPQEAAVLVYVHVINSFKVSFCATHEWLGLGSSRGIRHWIL